MNGRDELIGSVVSDRYRLDALRKGGADSTSVFDATDLQGGAGVVVRLLRADSLAGEAAATTSEVDDGTSARVDQAVAAFKRGLLGVAGVSHPVLVSPLDWGETTLADSRYAFVVTERIEGVSLRELLDRGRRLSASQAVVIALDLCRALHHLHKVGIVHGDVRPANVFVTENSRARLGGLGSKRLGDDSSMSIEQARYAAPELGENPAPTPSSDVYALALTVLETLTGDVPFAADSPAVTLANRAGRLLPVSADIGPVAVPIEKAARPTPGDRSSALEFGQSLAQIAAKLAPPKPIEALSGESFRDSITRTMETVVVEPPVRVTEPTVVVEVPAPAVDVAVPQPIEEKGRQRWIRTAAIVVAVVVSGILVWQALSTPSHRIPDLVGVAEGEARNQLSVFGWSLLVRAERSDDVELGAVIRTEPPAGSTLQEGSDLTLIVSEGASLAVLPDLVGLTMEDALAALAEQDLVPVKTVSDSDSVPSGSIVSWMVIEQPDLTAGSEVLRGTEVSIVISSGPSLRSVPELVGLTEEDALALLADLQFVGQRGEDVRGSDAAPGTVAAQTPQSGENLMRGSTIVYSLAAGSP